MVINTYDAKTNLSKLLDKVQAGETVTIANAGTPVADLVPHNPKPSKSYEDLIGSIKNPDQTDAVKRVRALRDDWR
jgi:prevent-host-death family protein